MTAKTGWRLILRRSSPSWRRSQTVRRHFGDELTPPKSGESSPAPRRRATKSSRSSTVEEVEEVEGDVSQRAPFRPRVPAKENLRAGVGLVLCIDFDGILGNRIEDINDPRLAHFADECHRAQMRRDLAQWRGDERIRLEIVEEDAGIVIRHLAHGDLELGVEESHWKRQLDVVRLVVRE